MSRKKGEIGWEQRLGRREKGEGRGDAKKKEKGKERREK